ncbi:excalibur calcium-binding domain-containing protein [Xinfangfangia sp. D13-10-4-6]|uniref:excalibur calcium-binding domain-containing protein n=1 Tax=Pseudogemmobacter hezensis TaxID=2737662 RepID=UPI0015525713|nr:excalibur calcium-binding domain-containing protein [Pseudogemmobacter hezensis]NPD17603.1 excalibur calcium-binding domain-containing protein [Pseudogemmobacter hezensis]
MISGKFFVVLGAIVALASCDAPASRSASLSTQSTASLCTQHLSATGVNLLEVEAELGARGVLQCTTTYGSKSYVGARTEATVGRALYSRSQAASSVRDDKNCSDFASAGEAQRFFIANGGPNRDPHGLDGDGDGNACEWGKELKTSAKRYKPAPVRASAPRRSSSRTCYTGPRGGRYYYSASGNKVYGC